MAVGPILKVADYVNKGRKFIKSPAGKKAVQTIKDKFKGKPKSLTEITKKVENKARKESSAIADKAQQAQRKALKESLNKKKGGNKTSKKINKSSEATPKRSYKQGFSKGGEVLKAPTNPGLKKLPTKVRNKMGYMKAGGKVGYSKGGIVDRQYLKGR
tara:strand:- start:1367 stop:1840 length:474 start_codon:yes stop_codon:yes gene_type:complete